MPTPKSHVIISAIVTRLKTISVLNGYQTNNGTRVEDSRPNWDETSDLPAISVFEGRTGSAEAPDSRRRTVHVMPVMIKTFLKRGTDAANARLAIADIKQAILGTGSQSDGFLAERWPVTVGGKQIGQAMVTRETGHSIEYAEGSFEVVGAQVEIEVQYITDKFNSYQ